MRNLILVLGDQLNHDSAALADLDPSRDAVWMAEVAEEATHVWCHKLRIAFFFSAMRHFRDELRERGIPVHYQELTHSAVEDRGRDFATVLSHDVAALGPEKLILVTPGDYRVRKALQQQADELNIPVEIRPDRHFFSGIDDFREFSAGRKKLVMETFYRQMRRKHGVLLERDGKPVGGKWNFDQDNRLPFSPNKPPAIPPMPVFHPDSTTRKILKLVEHRFSDHPGQLDRMDLPVTHLQARAMLDDFVCSRLPHFGSYEDAMWADQPFLYHSRLSALLNVKLLNPRDCVSTAVTAYEEGQAPLNSVEGFIRQILGWREYIRGVYWVNMPEYQDLNYFGHELKAPAFFWDGASDLECIRQTMQHVLRYGYSHHIHRLMVMGLFALLLGVHPRRFHEWHMAMYVDAVDWVSLPNTLGMSQYGDGGIVGSKPYCASGNYINRMSNFCKNCRYDYGASIGEKACPFTTLYWDFLDRHYDRLKTNPRLGPQLLNLERKRQSKRELDAIGKRAAELRRKWGG